MVLGLLLLAAGTPDAHAACGAPASLDRLDQPLPHVARRLAARSGGTLSIVAFGSSSTYGTGATSPGRAYPEQLALRLAERLPGVRVTVVNRGVAGETTADMLKRLDRDVLGQRPDLVIWQLGSNEALQRRPVDEFRTLAETGLARLAAAHADVVLMEPQQMAAAVPDAVVAAYVQAVRALGQAHGLPVVRRYDLMRAWAGGSRFRQAGLLGPDAIHMTDDAYACLARSVTDGLLAARPAVVVTASAR